ncbi:amidase [Methylosinus sp. H3A]|uniref:amidase n=1 Tax=Methylosinus sp. H3A TaxID=2785786 RepID=UPI0018C28B77|nr:amidase [Methylosinus sp. H3A]MBG0809531.1 amidase [Methylosinus sp. H3A]
MNEHIHDWTAVRLAQALRRRKLRVIDVVEHMLDRITARDSVLRSYVTVSASLARRQARRADAELEAGRIRSPLHGVPIAVKDSLATRGVATSNGAARLTDHYPIRDAAVVTRLDDSGLVMLGKLNLPEGAFGLHDPIIGAPRNPWHMDYWPGASSSGSGVATAAGLCFAAVGTDSGGSIRHPSAANNLFGLKPTAGLVDTTGVFPLAPSLDHVGPMARSPADLEALFMALAGAARRSVEVDEPDGGALRVGVDRIWSEEAVDPLISRAMRETEGRLVDLGMKLEPIHLPAWRECAELWMILCAREAVGVHAGLETPISPSLRRLLAFGATADADRVEAAVIQRKRLTSAIEDVFVGVDLILAPVQCFAPPRIDRLTAAEPDDRLPISPTDIGFTCLFNLTGHPALAMPAGFTEEGLPVGCQLVAPKGRERRLFHVARIFDKIAGFSLRRPQLASVDQFVNA